MNILVIEDDGPTRQKLVELLTAEGVHTVWDVSTIENALAFMKSADAILCDEQIPIAAGSNPFRFAWIGLRDAARRLRKHFVLLTTDPETRLEALHQDTTAYLKPDQAPEAVARLVRAVGQRPVAA